MFVEDDANANGNATTNFNANQVIVADVKIGSTLAKGRRLPFKVDNIRIQKGIIII